MQTTIRKLGNSAGVIIPKTILAELGLSAGDAVDCALKDGHLILTPAKGSKRAGWAEASRKIAESGGDALAWPEFANTGDDDLRW
jgi:antitoxin MazE